MRIAESLLHPLRIVRWALLTLLVALPALSQTQQSGKKGNDIDALLQDRTQALLPQPSAATGVALESVVDPEHYYVGPSDVIAVNIWMSPPLNLSLTVTPEGSLIIPTVGEVRVADMTLAEAKRAIIDGVRRKYLAPEVSATLLKPRSVVVSITGNVLNPGLYTMNAVDRANKLIDEANKLSKLQSPGDVAPLQKTMSLRHIYLKNKDGREHRVDLPMFFATHQDSSNPYLREGDVIVVPRVNTMRNVVGVYGQVNSPGRFEYVEGDRVLDALRMAHGPTHDALTDRAMFSRSTPDGSGLATTTLDLRAVIAGTQENFLLQPGDRLVLQGMEELREDYNVDVKGEVRYPATYPITKENTKISEVIRRAGGVTENADLHAATVLRRTIDERDVEREALISQRGIVSTQDTIGYGLENSLRITSEMVTVDLEKLLVQGDSTQDILLHGEDVILIPKKQFTVYVFGQVASPGHVAFADGADEGHYIRLAGGFTDRANRGDVKIVKSKTKQWLDPGRTKIEPGDYIWIPAEADHPFSYYMTVASQAASILSVVIGVAVLVVQVSK